MPVFVIIVALILIGLVSLLFSISAKLNRLLWLIFFGAPLIVALQSETGWGVLMFYLFMLVVGSPVLLIVGFGAAWGNGRIQDRALARQIQANARQLAIEQASRDADLRRIRELLEKG